MERRYRIPIISNRNVIFLQDSLIYKASSLRYRQVYHSAINVWMRNGMQTLISIMCLDDALLIENCRWSQRRNLKQILLKFQSSNALLRISDNRQKCRTILWSQKSVHKLIFDYNLICNSKVAFAFRQLQKPIEMQSPNGLDWSQLFIKNRNYLWLWYCYVWLTMYIDTSQV